MDVIEGRAVRIESAGPALEGLLHLPTGHPPFPAAVICHPHPQFGGEMHNNVVGALVRAALGVGAAALRFNFRGVGESEGSFGDYVGEQEDARTALAFLQEQPEINPDRVAIAGYSFGAVVALRVANELDYLPAVVAVSNPTVRGPKVELYLRMPALIVTGDRDQYCDAELLLEYRDQIGDDVTVEVLPGVDHFWWGSDGRLIEIVSEFLRRHIMDNEAR